MICASCKIEKDISSFVKRHDCNALRKSCSDCRNKYLKDYRNKNKEALKQKALLRPKKKVALSADQKKKNAARMAADRKNNPDKYISITKKNYEKNKKVLNQKSREYNLKNKDALKAYRQKEHVKKRKAESQSNYRKRNPLQAALSIKNHRAKNKNKYRIYARNRKSRERGAIGKYTFENIENLKALQKNKCAICFCKLDKFEIDHIVPLIRGGSNFPDNLQLTCVFCNRQKGSKLPEQYMRERGLLL